MHTALFLWSRGRCWWPSSPGLHLPTPPLNPQPSSPPPPPQILDDGRVTDSQGRVVSFKNCVIIMTSNLGSADVFEHLPSDSREALQARVMDAVRGHFRPEFVNRWGRRV